MTPSLPSEGVFDEVIQHDAPVPTWFGLGGRADMLARPRTEEELRDLLVAFAGQRIRILGDGANLLVDDEGVDGLVISLQHLDKVDWGAGERPIVMAQAGAKLPQLITEAVRRGIAGLEGLAGIPATVGGAVVMNAGGRFGEIGSVIDRVRVLTMTGQELSIPHDEIGFAYRHSGLEHCVILGAYFALHQLPESQQPALRDRLKEVMAYKKTSQPMAENSAGCCFKNAWHEGKLTSAGMLIDHAGCKGMTVGGAEVSNVHGNFLVTRPGCKARDVIELMELVRDRVKASFGVHLQNEVVIWRRGG